MRRTDPGRSTGELELFFVYSELQTLILVFGLLFRSGTQRWEIKPTSGTSGRFDATNDKRPFLELLLHPCLRSLPLLQLTTSPPPTTTDLSTNISSSSNLGKALLKNTPSLVQPALASDPSPPRVPPLQPPFPQLEELLPQPTPTSFPLLLLPTHLQHLNQLVLNPPRPSNRPLNLNLETEPQAQEE